MTNAIVIHLFSIIIIQSLITAHMLRISCELIIKHLSIELILD
jgi:hypothetical protein